MSRLSCASPMPTKNSGTLLWAAYFDTCTRSSPSVVTPSVSITMAASEEPRKSLRICRTAAPSWLEALRRVQAGDLGQFVRRLLYLRIAETIGLAHARGVVKEQHEVRPGLPFDVHLDTRQQHAEQEDDQADA